MSFGAKYSILIGLATAVRFFTISLTLFGHWQKLAFAIYIVGCGS
jgi:hypothetical protein